MAGIPMIDIGPLREEPADADAVATVATALDEACRDLGFFCIVGHGVDANLLEQLDRSARAFFALPESEKAEIGMAHAGRAWRGWFPLGGELTSGVADQKEGVYFGEELDDANALVRDRTPLHGSNLFPRRPPGLRDAVLAYVDALASLGQVVLGGLAVGLGLDRSWFTDHLTTDPLLLFRIFRYPPVAVGDEGWGVAEHTDYGLLTILAQDAQRGLQVRTPAGWTTVEPIPNSFVCNLGDMLERLTGGRYRSTPHRVRNTSTGDRLSYPFFLDPAWGAKVERLPIVSRPIDDGAADRWDKASVHGFTGTYGEYLMTKVAKVFPALAQDTQDRR